jgi:hypothetical protein
MERRSIRRARSLCAITVIYTAYVKRTGAFGPHSGQVGFSRTHNRPDRLLRLVNIMRREIAARGPTIDYCTENETTPFVATSMSAKSSYAQRRRADLRSVLPETILPVAAN